MRRQRSTICVLDAEFNNQNACRHQDACLCLVQPLLIGRRLAEEGKAAKEKLTLPTKTLDGQLVYEKPRAEGVETQVRWSCALP